VGKGETLARPAENMTKGISLIVRMKHLVAVALAVVAGFTSAEAVANDKVSPSWMDWNAGKNTVEMRVKAAYNGNNGSWNYNGYYEGGITIHVPLGSTVIIHFENPDGNYPHSLLVTPPYKEEDFPDQAGRDQVALSRAYTRSPTQGCHQCKEDVRFKARKAGAYYLYCGVVGHGAAGMWVHFVVSEEAEEPYITIASDAVKKDDQPPWL
jgi:sulfocyanin